MCSRSANALEPAVDKDGHAQCTDNTSRETGAVCGTARRTHFSLYFISVTVQIRIQVFLVISVYFNLRDILPKSGIFPRDTLYIASYQLHAPKKKCIYSNQVSFTVERHIKFWDLAWIIISLYLIFKKIRSVVLTFLHRIFLRFRRERAKDISQSCSQYSPYCFCVLW